MKLYNVLHNIVKRFGIDYVVETGTSGAWTYKKWKSGIAECWYSDYDAGSCAMTSSYGNGFYCSKSSYAYPPGLFIKAPCITVSTTCSSGLLHASVYNNTATSYSIFLWDTKSETLNVKLNGYAKGFWKTFVGGGNT